MSTADNIRWDIKQRTNRIAEAKSSIGNLTRHIAALNAEVVKIEREVKSLRADLLIFEPIKP